MEVSLVVFLFYNMFISAKSLKIHVNHKKYIRPCLVSFFLFWDIVVFSFLFDKYYPIMD